MTHSAVYVKTDPPTVLIAGRPAEIQRCHRCGKLLVPDLRIIQNITIQQHNGGRYVTCAAHPFRFHNPSWRSLFVGYLKKITKGVQP